MTRYYGPMHDGGGDYIPPDLERSNTAAAESAARGSKDSYTKTIKMPLIKNKKYKFFFTYKYEDPETKEIKESDRSPVWIETFDIPNLTKAVQNLTLTAGFKSYGVKFDLDPTSVQEDVVIFESLTGVFAGEEYIVYVGVSTNVTIQTSNYAPRWVKVRSRDKWDDLNITDLIAGPVTPLNSEVDTTTPPGAPTNVVVAGFNETSDPSNYTGYANVTWTAPSSGAKGYNVGVWESIPGTTIPNREFKVDATFAKVDGLFVGKSYYIQVKSLSAFNTPSVWVPPALNYPVTIPGNTAVPGAVTISGVGTPKSIVLSWTVPSSNADLVTSGGYYIAKLYSSSAATGTPLQTKTCYSNSATFAGLTTGSQYWVTIQAYTSGASPVAGNLSSVYGPLVPTAVEPPDIQADFILANNQFQVGGTSGANDVHLSAYPKTVGGLLTNGRIYIGGPETSGSAAVGLYNSNGTPFYADNLGRFSLGDKLTWSGGALNVIGTIDVTGASTFSSYIVSGATNSTFIGIGKQVPYRVSGTLQSGVNGLTGIVINKSGTVTNSDYIKSDGSFSLGEGGLVYNGSLLSLAGNIEAKGGTITGNLRVTTGSIIAGGTFDQSGNVSGARVVMQTNGLYAHAADGTQSVVIQSSDGLIDARKGYIGGWTINGTAQTVGTISKNNTLLDSSGNITVGDTTGTLGSIVRLSGTDPTYRLWIGSNSGSSAPFRVTKEGVLYATGAVITLATGSTIDGYATTAALGNYTLSSVTTGINSRLQTVEGAYVSASTLNTGLATKNTTFVSDSAPTANRTGDIWIDISSAAGNEIKTWNGSSWTSRRDTTFAKTTDLSTKLNATSYVVQNSQDNSISMNTNGITVFSGATSNNGFNSGITFNSAGIAAWKNGNPTFSILTDGTATFYGTLSAATGSFSGSVTASSGSIGGFDLGSTYGDLTAKTITSVRPRIIFGSKILLGWISSSTYGLQIGNDYDTTNARFIVNTADDVFRASIDTTRKSYAMEVAIALRAYQLRYSTSSGYGLIAESSSRRFKENITYLPKTFYERILNVSPATWTYKHNVEGLSPEMGGMHSIGLIAEDLEEAGLSYFVERDMQGRPTNLQNMIDLPQFLIPIIRDLKAEVSDLKSRLEAVENV